MPNLFSFNVVCGASFIFGDMYDSIVQGTWTSGVQSDQKYNFSLRNLAGVQNDGVIFKIWVEEGDKTFYLLGRQGVNCGIATVTFDGVSIGAIDMYDPGGLPNILYSLPVTVLGTGEHTVQIVAATKNPEAGKYILAITRLWVK